MATENPTFDGNSSAILLVVYESVRVCKGCKLILTLTLYTGLPRLLIVFNCNYTALCGPLHLMLTVTLGKILPIPWVTSYPPRCFPWVRLLSLRARHAFASAVVEAARGQGGPSGS